MVPEKKFSRILEDEGWKNCADFFVGMNAATRFRRAVSAVGRRISTSSSPVLMGFQTAMQAPTSFVLYTHIFVQAFKSEAEEILENCKCMIYFLCIHTMAFIAWPKGY